MRQPQGVHRRGAGAQGSARPCSLRRAAGPRQDDAGADRLARAWRQLPLDLRSGDRQGGRPRRAAHQSRRARRALHRRDPSPVAGGGGNPLSGARGFSARPDHRRGAGGAFGQDRTRALHADWRDDAPRPAHHAAPRSLRHSDPPQLLRGRGAGAHRPAWRAHPRRRTHRRRRDRDRTAFARHAAHRDSAPSACPRFRLRRWRRGRSTRRAPTAPCGVWKSTLWASTPSTGATCA